MQGVVDTLQLVGQVLRVVVAQRVDEVRDPALPALQVLVEPIDSGLAASSLFPSVKLILQRTQQL